MCINEIATICSVVRDDGWKKNGTNILRLRLTFRRQSRYIKTNILLRKNQLDRNGQIKDTAVLLKVTTLIKQLEERLSSLDAFALSNMSIEDVARSVSAYTACIAFIHGQARLKYNDEETGIIRIRNPFQFYKPPRQKITRHRDIDAKLIQKMIDMRNVLSGREKLTA